MSTRSSYMSRCSSYREDVCTFSPRPIAQSYRGRPYDELSARYKTPFFRQQSQNDGSHRLSLPRINVGKTPVSSSLQESLDITRCDPSINHESDDVPLPSLSSRISTITTSLTIDTIITNCPNLSSQVQKLTTYWVKLQDTLPDSSNLASRYDLLLKKFEVLTSENVELENNCSFLEAKLSTLQSTIAEKFTSIEDCLQTQGELIQKISDNISSQFSHQNDLLTNNFNAHFQSPSSPSTNPTFLVLQPKSPDISLQIIEDHLLLVNPIDIPAISYYSTTNGNIVIKCTSSDEVSKVHTLLSSSSVSTVSNIIIPSPRILRLILFNAPRIPDSLEDYKNYLSNILKPALQNHNISSDSLTVLKYFHDNNKPNNSHVIFDIEKNIGLRLLQMQKINIGFQLCIIKPYINVRRCTKCQTYGHHRSSCTSFFNCGFCAGSHFTTECPHTSEVKCINCFSHSVQTNNPHFSSNHSAFSKQCPLYQSHYQAALRKSRLKYQYLFK